MGHVLPGEVSAQPPHFRELEEAGLVVLEPIRRDGKTNWGVRLTAQDVVAVRFFTGQGVVPAYLRDVFGDVE